jgi:hypothetical protein
VILGWKVNVKYFFSVDIERLEGLQFKTMKMLQKSKAIPTEMEPVPAIGRSGPIVKNPD